MGLKPQVGPPEPILAPNPNNHKMAKMTPGPQIGHNKQWTPLSTHGLCKPPAQFHQVLPSIKGKTFPSFMDLVPKDPGVVHIWYNIPLCTIFAQKCNGDVFRIQICHFNSSPQIHHPL
ncbi:hypothetical protein O181_020450 [Austropuccinia psidii MF-1]|uniref:Uncharacterized protein n=1 Tax=Austropuccinia psidii MF-1 TaxID=1389203 RepID=A0A9Q3CDS7_9BASI|nr:hypothetical protein [Austropuccinia psidii MF-1]